MKRSSMTIISSATILATVSADISSSAQQLWYPEFGTTYESGRCTTTPSPGLAAFATGSTDPSSSLAVETKTGCCDAWFSEQELCGCLGGCEDEQHEHDDVTTTAPATAAAEPLTEEERSWYPAFTTTYESGTCVKFGINTNAVPPTYYTKEGGFLHTSLDGCCGTWFEHQETNHCMNAMDAQVVVTSVSNNTSSSTSSSTKTMQEVSSVSVQAALVVEESI